MVRIHLALGRKSNIRPADLVGAIANEAGISGREIGKIEMGNGFSLVEVPESSVDTVIDALAERRSADNVSPLGASVPTRRVASDLTGSNVASV